MKLILGLGNPEEKYFGTRHNFGFRVVDAFREQHEFSEFKFEKKFNAELSEGKIGKEKVLLAKPQTFMNLSGEAAGKLLKFYKPAFVNFLAVYDDVDLPFGVLRIRAGGSDGGHRGVRNLIEHFGTENFARLRLGTANELLDLATTEEFVLAKFSRDEEKRLPEILAKAVETLENFLKKGVENLTL